MRARLNFTTDSVEEALIVVLKEHFWWPDFPQDSQHADRIIKDVRDSLDDKDVDYFDSSKKLVLSHTPTESYGTLTMEHNVWVLRLLNPSIHSLQLACETLVKQVVDYANNNRKRIEFVRSVQIVERKRKETIIEGQVLATSEERTRFARSHRRIEFIISRLGACLLAILILITYPWPFRDIANPHQNWVFSVFEKFIGSVAVTTFISYVQYRSFLSSQQEHTIRWSIPGEPEKRDIKPGAG